ncbi:MAG: hypothetical protein COC19_05020 [SAR86 cluster bacterium]|uniref:Transmembrane protein n=1 Tax=SAR86 cluster bacterium TaxID=2030880 RepID=A0A2A4MMS6_9GAMM|nr:MAG: hypothetical protein COC19_05020 [SAR86 cluster bacterium]
MSASSATLGKKATLLTLILVLLWSTTIGSKPVYAHGGVVFGEDVCVITIGFLRAHFTVYQPDTRGSKEYCEGIPDITNTEFVMEYLHDFLEEMPVDFRIIRDVNEVGKFAKWEDVQAIEDLEAATVFYQPPEIKADGFFRVSHEFDQKGTYIGIVTAQHPQEDKTYNAVFYFQVGGFDYGTIPAFVAALIALQLLYWLSTGGLARRRAKQQARQLNKQGGA